MFIYVFEYLISFVVKNFLLCKLKFEILAPGAKQKKSVGFEANISN